MVLDYIPCDTEKINDIYIEYCKLKHIKNEDNKIFFELLDDRFCKYIIKKGKYKNMLCMRKFTKKNTEGDIYCHTHRYQEKKCSINKCRNKCKKTSNKCNKHYKEYKTKVENIEEKEYKKNNHEEYRYIEYYEYPVNIKIKDIKIKDIKKSDILPSEKKEIKRICYNKEKVIKNIYLNNKSNQNWLKIKTCFIFICKFLNTRKNKKKEILQNTSIFKNKEYLEYYLSNTYYLLKNINSLELLKINIYNYLEIICSIYNLNINENYLELVNSNENKLKSTCKKLILWIRFIKYLRYKLFIKEIINKSISKSLINNILTINNKKSITNRIIYNTKIYKANINRRIIIKELVKNYDVNNIKYITYLKNDKSINKNNNYTKNNKKKFKKKYLSLIDINKKYKRWAKNNLTTEFYIDKIENIIDSNMEWLESKIEEEGKNIDNIKNTYRMIYEELYNSWEMENPYEEIEKKDLKTIFKQEWKEYGIYEDDEYKKLMKI